MRLKKFRLLLSLLLPATVYGQKAFTNNDFAGLKWLHGSWKGMAGKEAFYEGWRSANDSTMVNFSIEIKGSDTLIKESGALILRNNKIYLGDKPTQWTATRLMANEIVLRNDSLRFSNTIIWLHTADDHWFTLLEHPKSTVYYDMTRDAALDRKLEEWLAAKKKKG